jgi:hypothetical protein
MIFTLFTLALAGTAVAQNPLFSFARNRMMRDNDKVSLQAVSDMCPWEDLVKLSSEKPGQEFDCIVGAYLWHCTGSRSLGFGCSLLNYEHQA